ncbi:MULTISPECIES: glutathione peroxidase [Streptococcus]|jgi:glutathione peroxidase|uniref:glutathione peroxidase n=1 Tax=Streptococcus TaxID=1301 RepID=UPI0007797A02|nr:MULTISPECIES: glutathione peroxidase [Streptococcus]MBW7662383.1 glutathione peroxidase [Streptococcus gordonii]OFU73463.1 glutathione peroxidase [Streptococcus sp. HMSC10A01]VTT24387.1 glutathione peroxidase [Streptococcus gordonii]
MNVYQFSVEKQDGSQLSLDSFNGKVLLIVNTATGCGFTPQYKGLQELYLRYHGEGFEILDFPCNQFKNQAPGNAEEINNFCRLNYQTTFPRFQKINVNGKEAAPLYTWLKKEKGGFLSKDIKWNFTKFLLDKEGHVINRYSPQTSPQDIENDIQKLLK